MDNGLAILYRNILKFKHTIINVDLDDFLYRCNRIDIKIDNDGIPYSIYLGQDCIEEINGQRIKKII